jgi:competence protein CoiA
MLTGVNQAGLERMARDATKPEGPFHCPECAGLVTLKKGTVRAHHFAHVPPFDCWYGQGESEDHRRAKYSIYDAMIPLTEGERPRVTYLGVEKAIQKDVIKVRPDIYFWANGIAVAIEVQRSTLDPRDIAYRTSLYYQLGIAVLWVIPWPATLDDRERYIAKETDKYLHSLYFGKVFYWQERDFVIPVKFGDHMLWVESRTWYEGGQERSAGGYEKLSRRYVTPYVGSPARIVDMTRHHRGAYSMKSRQLPAAWLWTVKN